MRQARRADHGWFYPEMVLGMVFVALAMMQAGPSPDPEIGELTPYMQDVATMATFVGGVVAVVGVLLNTMLLPLNVRARTHYTVTVTGLLLLGVGTGAYALAAVWEPSSLWVPISGLAVFINAAAVRAGVDVVMMWRDDHRRRRNED